MTAKDDWILRALGHEAYRVLPDGTVQRRRGSVLPVWEDQPLSVHAKSGRLFFNLRYEALTKSVLVNRVVALALVPNPLGLPEVNHDDGDVTNNRPGNLVWADRSTQEKHAFAHGLKANRGSANGNAKLTADQVLTIRASTRPTHELAHDLRVSVRAVEDARERRTWKHLP